MKAPGMDHQLGTAFLMADELPPLESHQAHCVRLKTATPQEDDCNGLEASSSPHRKLFKRGSLLKGW